MLRRATSHPTVRVSREDQRVPVAADRWSARLAGSASMLPGVPATVVLSPASCCVQEGEVARREGVRPDQRGDVITVAMQKDDAYTLIICLKNVAKDYFSISKV